MFFFSKAVQCILFNQMNQATLLKWHFDSKEIVTKINLLLSDASKRSSATRKCTVWNKLG